MKFPISSSARGVVAAVVSILIKAIKHRSDRKSERKREYIECRSTVEAESDSVYRVTCVQAETERKHTVMYVLYEFVSKGT